jgi:GTP-binding protein
VLTKTDKIKPTELAKTLAGVETVAKTHVAAFPQVLATSAETGAGIPELRAAVVAAAKA